MMFRHLGRNHCACGFVSAKNGTPCVVTNADAFHRKMELYHLFHKNEHGAAILESLLAMMLLAFLLFGIFQLFQLSVADMIVEYASFRGARSAAVGFNDTLATREARVKVIPASGDMLEPFRTTEFYSNYAQFEREKEAIRRYMKGTQWMEYSNWYGDQLRHTNYHCPDYGKPLQGNCGICGPTGAHLETSINSFNERTHFDLEFRNYPLQIPLADYLTGMDRVQIEKETEIHNHSSSFLE